MNTIIEKKPKLFLVSIAIITSFILLTQCKKEEESLAFDLKKDIAKTENIDNFFIDVEAAQIIAENPFQSKTDLKANETMATKKLINKKSIKDKNGKDALHIFNYDTEGKKSFVIVSGDKRLRPVLAYSNKNNFNFDNALPNGIEVWLNSIKKGVSLLRTNNINIETNNNINYKRYNFPGDIEEPGEGGDPDDCLNFDYTYKVGPLLNTDWGNDGIYNKYYPTIEYSSFPIATTCDGGIRVTSKAVAAAQVMRHYKHPISYNWNIMLDSYYPDIDNYAADETARLMLDLDVGIHGYRYHDYISEDTFNWCGDFIGEYPLTSIKESLEDDFGYTNGGDILNFRYNYEMVKSNLRNSKPVIMYGGTDFISGVTYHHIWVCDGYELFQNNCFSLLYFHMNWGLDTDLQNDFDAWYAFLDFKLLDKHYVYLSVICNITP